MLGRSTPVLSTGLSRMDLLTREAAGAVDLEAGVTGDLPQVLEGAAEMNEFCSQSAESGGGGGG